MATIVKVKESGQHAVLLGVDYGAYSSARAGKIMGDMFPVEQSGKCQMVAISNTTGNINWCKAEDIEVVTVDGKSLSDILTGYANISDEFIGVPLLESADDVKDDFRYQEFITEDPERLSIYSDDLVERFNRWLEIKNTY